MDGCRCTAIATRYRLRAPNPADERLSFTARRPVSPYGKVCKCPLMSQHTYLESFAFGRLCRDQTFPAEQVFGDARDSPSRESSVTSKPDKCGPVRLLKYDLDDHSYGELETELGIRYPAQYIIAIAASPSASPKHLVFTHRRYSKQSWHSGVSRRFFQKTLLVFLTRLLDLTPG